MTTVKPAPETRFEWELEETLVDRRNRLPNRIARLARQTWLWMLLAVIVIVALMNADVMTAFIAVLGFVVMMAFYIGMALIQFVALFWFLSRSRMYTIMPDA